MENYIFLTNSRSLHWCPYVKYRHWTLSISSSYKTIDIVKSQNHRTLVEMWCYKEVVGDVAINHIPIINTQETSTIWKLKYKEQKYPNLHK